MDGSLDRLTTPAGLLADLALDVSEASCRHLRNKQTILYMGTEPYDSATVPRMTLKV